MFPTGHPCLRLGETTFFWRKKQQFLGQKKTKGRIRKLTMAIHGGRQNKIWNCANTYPGYQFFTQGKVESSTYSGPR